MEPKDLFENGSEKTKESPLKSLETDLILYSETLKEIALEILVEKLSEFPIFIAHQHQVSLGEQVVDKEELSTEWNINVSFLEDFINADYDAALGTIFTSVSREQEEFMPEEFAKLTVPTLLVAGEYDIIIPAELGKRAAALNDNVELTIIANTAHFPMLEDPTTYLERVRNFLNN